MSTTFNDKRRTFDTIRYFLNFAPQHFFAGLALGGLIATIGATLYVLDRAGKIDLLGEIEGQLKTMDKIKIKRTPDDVCDGSCGNPNHDHECNKTKSNEPLGIPLPLVLPLIGWTVALLWSSTRAAYRGRVDLMFGNFFHSVTVTLMTTRNATNRVVQRRLAERTLDDISYGNRYLTAMIKQAAGAASINNPVLKLPASQAKHVLNTLQGHISGLNADSRINADLGGAFKEQRYWFALTYAENNLRTLVMSEDFIMNFKNNTCDSKDLFHDHEMALHAAVDEVLKVQATLVEEGYKLEEDCNDMYCVHGNPVANFVNKEQIKNESIPFPIIGTVQLVGLS